MTIDHRSSSTRGAGTGDVLVFLATLGVVVALLYPAWSVRGFRAQVESAVADAETLAAAARSFRDDNGRWPDASAPGEPPPQLSGLAGQDGLYGSAEYTLGWTSWAVVDSVPAPRPTDLPSADDAPQASAPPRMLPVVRRVGAVTVHSGDESLLAELLERYPDGASFVLDTMWLWVLPERAQPLFGR